MSLLSLNKDTFFTGFLTTAFAVSGEKRSSSSSSNRELFTFDLVGLGSLKSSLSSSSLSESNIEIFFVGLGASFFNSGCASSSSDLNKDSFGFFENISLRAELISDFC